MSQQSSYVALLQAIEVLKSETAKIVQQNEKMKNINNKIVEGTSQMIRMHNRLDNLYPGSQTN